MGSFNAKVTILQKVEEWEGLEWVRLEAREADEYFKICRLKSYVIMQ